jgi:hypothetical protein
MLRCHLHVLFEDKSYMTQTTTSVEKGGYVTQEYQEKMKGKG